MSKITVWFIRVAMSYFIIAAGMGVLMIIWPWWTRTYIPGHAHLNLLGWISMTIYGVAYHIIPRFSGRPLYSNRLAWLHFYLANIGLIGMVLFFGFVGHGNLRYEKHLLYSAIVEFTSIVIFVYNMMRTIKSAEG
ncbi:MAG: hypothetical protein A3I04_07785 [Nitrospinae bacterium RIFCSPLOWO2_02_FULL_39_110]|nr:MAG: hypothetical protein A2W53_03070 [Nitrospinae bacterium RIFCSPHIGHO2_02_39_11]OGV99439.1 MAG: hypothetical protein A3D97_06800 [Nitrospinae bacterium RIFCSPHIGHO2_12_FULL_39_42]OGW01405.1 MAG: hypothetical protein A3D20_02590 [Nitrospinae bacterium RIFCSPHIGHO2_02_FULL_39_82]OGW03869.1 MAG: hypothetical protein A3I04_07785 [Nitrospinae bacterium RIFCSPLOWO2_02_FULL_39_110]OGW06946.1 MAG: hypothetical protein A2Z59_09200 [Nitrospinae bacterium RIFCSPLOWO2_02_39_17]OGW10685.1 MAG: hypoth